MKIKLVSVWKRQQLQMFLITEQLVLQHIIRPVRVPISFTFPYFKLFLVKTDILFQCMMRKSRKRVFGGTDAEVQSAAAATQEIAPWLD